MGKSKSAPPPPPAPPPQPAFQNTSYKIGDQTVSRTYKKGNEVITEIIETPEQKRARLEYERLLNEYLRKGNVLSVEYMDNRDSQLDAYKNKGIEYLDEIYSPMIKNVQNDAMSRFGTLNSSSFLSGLNDVEKNRSKSAESLSRDLLLMSDQLDDAQRQRQFAYMDLLSSISNGYASNYSNYANMSQSSNSNVNNMFQNQYNAMLPRYQSTPTESKSSKWKPFYL